VGIYETYDGDVVQLIDFVGERCGSHRTGQRLEPGDKSAHTPPVSTARRSS
jgi:hypothetical protein